MKKSLNFNWPVKASAWILVLVGSTSIFSLILYFTHDIIITNYLAYRICRAAPRPKTFIKKTVEFPESIYWEDNVYPGFDQKDRLLMIRNYLDGIHLKTMALNSPDGSIYLFTATAADWQKSKDIKARKREGNYFDALDSEARAIALRGKIYTAETLPQTNYSVVFNPVELSPFERRYLWSDEVVITENTTGEVIAFNRRLMRRWYRLLNYDAVGGRYYYPHAMCGENGIILEGTVFSYAKKFHNQIQKHTISLNFLMHNKKEIGENNEH